MRYARRAVAALATVVVLVTLACTGASDSTAPAVDGGTGAGVPAGGVLSIAPTTAHIPPLSTQEILDAIQGTYDAGARGYYVSYRWDELEPTAGDYQLSQLAGTLNTVTGLGFTRLYVSIHVINTNQKETPPDLQSIAWDAPVMQVRFRQLLDHVLPLLGPNVAYLGIGNEVDAWLGPHDEWSAYETFFSQARSYVHVSKPALPVGVATIFDGARGAW